MKIWHESMGLCKMIIIVVAWSVVNNVVLINAKIPSESMEKTIMTGDRVSASVLLTESTWICSDMRFPRRPDPERFDIVIFKYPDDESQLFSFSV